MFVRRKKGAIPAEDSRYRLGRLWRFLHLFYGAIGIKLHPRIIRAAHDAFRQCFSARFFPGKSCNPPEQFTGNLTGFEQAACMLYLLRCRGNGRLAASRFRAFVQQTRCRFGGPLSHWIFPFLRICRITRMCTVLKKIIPRRKDVHMR